MHTIGSLLLYHNKACIKLKEFYSDQFERKIKFRTCHATNRQGIHLEISLSTRKILQLTGSKFKVFKLFRNSVFILYRQLDSGYECKRPSLGTYIERSRIPVVSYSLKFNFW